MAIADSFFAHAHAHAQGVFGDTVACKRPADVAAEEVQAVISPERRERRKGEDGLEVVTVRDLVVRDGDLPGGFPRVDMTWTVSGKQYSTDAHADATGGFSTVTVMRTESRRSQRKNYSG
jgi:hypothetical protein